MNFDRDETLLDLAGLAADVFRQYAEVGRIEKVEADGGFDRELWASLASTGLLAAPLPEADGGADLGTTGLVAIEEQHGAAVAPVPLWPVVAGAALPLSRFGSAEQRARRLPSIVDGSTIVVGAPGAQDRLRLTPSGDGYRLDGNVPMIEGAPVADSFLLPADLGGRTRLALVSAAADGVQVDSASVTSRVSAGAVRFVGAVVDELLPDTDGVDQGRWLLDRCRIAQAGLQLGVGREALARTAAYTSEREQFGRPLSTNQSVAVRAADAYLDTQALALTTMKAAWLADGCGTGEADSRIEVTVASCVATWWASHGGLRVVHATQHLHGGLGADITYPIHRYFLWGRQIAFTNGTAAQVAAELGELVPSAPAIGGAA
ncbi:acyl-CoA dehydrogenase family protein [Gordonia neofelifaecis]|uniref:Acyl-CoA dehydrogenase n=1 Tax=Gordonia neofelifaecis NRRL B-59395 TaxID=644548 RepID=F1YNU7_9ACTN|nr:acyl-CoA dehydrogenase family protein [Gordonia neofelifaecis]EGD53566.1 acyl-CoA dehydrogenase [Gordonia neofelifaecis NRRL B-59395]